VRDRSPHARALERVQQTDPPSLADSARTRAAGKAVDLPPESEEVAGFFGKMIETDHAQDKVFRANFFRDFKTVLKKFPPRNGIAITELDKCDFSAIHAHFEEERERTKSLSAAAKKEYGLSPSVSFVGGHPR